QELSIMKNRIIGWAIAGGLVSLAWSIYGFVGRPKRIEPAIRDIALIMQPLLTPVARLFSFSPGFWGSLKGIGTAALLIEAAYAVIRLVIEALRPKGQMIIPVSL